MLKSMNIHFKDLAGFNPSPHRDGLRNFCEKEQTQILQLLYQLPDKGLLCLLMDILIRYDPTVFVRKFIYIIIYNGWSLA